MVAVVVVAMGPSLSVTGTGTTDVTAGDANTTPFDCTGAAVAASPAEGAAAVPGDAATIRAGTAPGTGMGKGMVVTDGGMDAACVAQLGDTACMVVVAVFVVVAAVGAAAGARAAGDFMLTSVVALAAADATVAAAEGTGCVDACAWA